MLDSPEQINLVYFILPVSFLASLVMLGVGCIVVFFICTRERRSISPINPAIILPDNSINLAHLVLNNPIPLARRALNNTDRLPRGSIANTILNHPEQLSRELINNALHSIPYVISRPGSSIAAPLQEDRYVLSSSSSEICVVPATATTYLLYDTILPSDQTEEPHRVIESTRLPCL